MFTWARRWSLYWARWIHSTPSNPSSSRSNFILSYCLADKYRNNYEALKAIWRRYVLQTVILLLVNPAKFCSQDLWVIHRRPSYSARHKLQGLCKIYFYEVSELMLLLWGRCRVYWIAFRIHYLPAGSYRKWTAYSNWDRQHVLGHALV
jgi:hypothetical protein